MAIEHEILRNFLHQLRDFSVDGASRAPCFLFELNPDKHRRAIDIIQMLRDTGVITSGFGAVAIIGDEITWDLELRSFSSREAFESQLEEMEHYGGPCFEELVSETPEDSVDDQLYDIFSEIGNTTPDEWDRANGTNYTKRVFELQQIKDTRRPKVIGLDKDWARDVGRKAFNNPYRQGFCVTAVDKEKLKQVCQENGIRLPSRPPERKIFAKLTYSGIDQPTVFMDDKFYVGNALKDYSDARKIINHAFLVEAGKNTRVLNKARRELFSTKLEEDGIIKKKRNLAKEVFRKNPLAADGCLAPFASIAAGSIIITDETLLTEEEAARIRKEFKLVDP